MNSISMPEPSLSSRAMLCSYSGTPLQARVSIAIMRFVGLTFLVVAMLSPQVFTRLPLVYTKEGLSPTWKARMNPCPFARRG